MSWPQAKLSQVATIERESIDPATIAPGTDYLGLEHIESGGAIIGHGTVASEEIKSSKFRFSPDHVLYGKLRPYLAKIALPEFEGICSTDILPIRPGPKIERRFLAYFLKQPCMVDFASSRSTGANLPRLSPKALSDFDIPVPPLKEQRRIAAMLGEADELRRLRRKSIDRLNDLAQSIFQKMFQAELAENSSQPLSKLVDEFRYGTSNKASSHGAPTLRIPNIVRGTIDLRDLKHVSVNEREFSRLKLAPGDLLFVRTNGNPAYVGRCAVVPDTFPETEYRVEEFIYASYLIRARLPSSSSSAYVQAFLESPNGRKQLLEKAKTSAGQFNINIDGLSSLLIPRADRSKQERFRKRLAKLVSVKAAYQSDLANLETLFYSVQQRAFAEKL